MPSGSTVQSGDIRTRHRNAINAAMLAIVPRDQGASPSVRALLRERGFEEGEIRGLVQVICGAYIGTVSSP